MTRVMYVLFLCIGSLFILVVGCSAKSQDISQQDISKQDMSKTDKVNILPAVEIVPQNKIIPDGGISQDKAKELVIKYLMNEGVKGDIKSSLTIDEITIKEAWENLKVQLFSVKLDYATLHSIVVVKDGKILNMLAGMPILETFLADIDKDGMYEIYANVYFGSGIVSGDISGYNIATNTKFYISKRTEKDYKLFIKDNTLLVKEYPYNHLTKGSDTAPDIKALKIEKDKLVLENLTLDYGFAVYKVKSESIKKALSYGSEKNVEYSSGEKIDLASIEIEGTPIFTDLDIKKYDWISNTIVFNTDFLENHPLLKEDMKIIGGPEKSVDDNKSSGNSYKLTEDELRNIERSIGTGVYNIEGGSKLLGCSSTDAVIIVVGDDRIYSSGFVLPALLSSSPAKIFIEDSEINSIKIRSKTELNNVIQDKRIYAFFKNIGKLEE
ncbi:MAG: hypothetical protein ACYDG2_19075 [Ruminiclostridium sp.]